jgi:hypothetical protein
MARIERQNSHTALKLKADAADSPRIPYGAVAGGCLFAVSGSGTVTWHVAFEPDGDTYPMFDAKNAPVTSDLVEGNAIDLPAALFAAPFIVAVGADVEAVLSVSG